MNALSLRSIGHIDSFVTPADYSELTIKSPAVDFFTDFTINKPLVIESSLPAIETKLLMKKAHVRLKLVINEKEQLVGIVSADDLLDRKIVQKLGKGDNRQDLSITDFMTPRDKLSVLEFSEVENANIGAVIHSLKSLGQQHCLVVDSSVNAIRGLFSASDISRKLKVDIDIQDQPSFSKLANKLD